MAARGLEPRPLSGQEPKSCVSANFTKRPVLPSAAGNYRYYQRLSANRQGASGLKPLTNGPATESREGAGKFSGGVRFVLSGGEGFPMIPPLVFWDCGASRRAERPRADCRTTLSSTP